MDDSLEKEVFDLLRFGHLQLTVSLDSGQKHTNVITLVPSLTDWFFTRVGLFRKNVNRSAVDETVRKWWWANDLDVPVSSAMDGSVRIVVHHDLEWLAEKIMETLDKT